MRTKAYNGLSGTLVCSSTPWRVGVKLDDGRLISVRMECIVTSDDFPSCSICFQPMLPTTTQRLLCSHTFHWWCAKQWRVSGNLEDIEAPTARCPLCRTYIGQSNESILSMTAPEIVTVALGSIHQTVAHLKGLPEPSFEEELQAVSTQVTQCKLNHQAFPSYQILQGKLNAYKADKSSANCEELRDALLGSLVVHCYPDNSTSADDTYAKAISMWMGSLFGRE
jgi:hypothetical protein